MFRPPRGPVGNAIKMKHSLGPQTEPLMDPGCPIFLCPQFPGNNFPLASSTAGNKTVSVSWKIMCHRLRVIHWGREGTWQSRRVTPSPQKTH